MKPDALIEKAMAEWRRLLEWRQEPKPSVNVYNSTWETVHYALAAERAASAEREEAVRELVKAVHAFGPCEFDPIDAALARLAAAWPAVVDGGEGG